MDEYMFKVREYWNSTHTPPPTPTPVSDVQMITFYENHRFFVENIWWIMLMFFIAYLVGCLEHSRIKKEYENEIKNEKMIFKV